MPAPTVVATSTSVTVAVHVVHAAIVIIGAFAIVGVLAPGWWYRRRTIGRLRKAAAAGQLVELARARAELEAEAAAVGPEAKATRLKVVAASLATLGASAVHVAVAPEHFAEGLRFGIFFCALASLQTVWSVAIVKYPVAKLAVWGAIGNSATVALWCVTRTTNLPWGLDAKEPVGYLDVVATTTEIIAVIAALMAAVALLRNENRNDNEVASGNAHHVNALGG